MSHYVFALEKVRIGYEVILEERERHAVTTKIVSEFLTALEGQSIVGIGIFEAIAAEDVGFFFLCILDDVAVVVVAAGHIHGYVLLSQLLQRVNVLAVERKRLCIALLT